LSKHQLHNDPCQLSTLQPLEPSCKNSGKNVNLIAPDVRKGFQNSGDMYLRGDQLFMDRLQVHPSLNPIVHSNREGLTYGAIINTLCVPIDVPKGTRFGTITSTCSDTDLGHFPGRTATLSTTSNLTGPQRQKADTESYIKAFLSSTREEVTANQSSSKGTDCLFDPNTCDDKQKRIWLQDNFDLKSSPFNITPSDLRSAENCLLQIWDSFSHDGSYGIMDLLKHDIVTTSPHPIKFKYRTINRALEPTLRLQLDKWLANDVIEPAMLPWSANLVAAKKKNGAIRRCLDWRYISFKSPAT
jgi:hypothetical protein